MKLSLTVSRALFLGILAATGAAVSAQECRLSIGASDAVLLPGETTTVDVAAHFPGWAYAFAAAELDVSADLPVWTFASDGVIAGGNVLGIAPSQAHEPFNGVFADPSNPLRVWTGVYAPVSYEPRLVEVSAIPSAFWVYPSELTGSSVECEAEGGRSWIFVNPERFGPAWVAPGEGTEIEFDGGVDILVGGAGDDWMLFGMLVPAVQKVRIGPWQNPDSLRIDVSPVRSGDDAPTESITLGYAKAPQNYYLEAEWPLGEGFEYVLLKDGAVVRRFEVETGAAPFRPERLPDVHSVRVERLGLARALGASKWAGPAVFVEFEYDEAVGVVLGDGTRVEADEVHVRARSANNLKQMGLAVHCVYEIRGQQITYVGLE